MHNIYQWNVFKRVFDYLKTYGFKYTIQYALEKKLAFLFYSLFYKNKKDFFLFDGEKLNYFYSKNAPTWANERCVEIAIFKKIIEKEWRVGKKVLEIGNTLSHYLDVYHFSVDKYEKGDRVINEDITTFKTGEKYDLILSISTLEHVGWDENPKEVEKIKKAFRRDLLKKEGLFIFSVPLHYNTYLDELIYKNQIKIDKKYFFNRVGKNEWIQCSEEETKITRYGSPFFAANSIMIGVIKK